MRDRGWSNSNQTALTVKATIVLVCKEWKSIGTEMLYECIRIRHGTPNLLSALESTRYLNPDSSESGPEFEFDYGRWVRRIEISAEILDFDSFDPLPILCIFQCCPFVQTVVRVCHIVGSGGGALGSVHLPPGTTFPSFPSIKRIDWWLSGIVPFSWKTEVGAVSGFLGELVVHSPGLEYLTLSGGDENLFSQSPCIDPFGGMSGPFDSLTTLRLESENVNVILTQPTLLLPNLSRLIFGGAGYAAAKIQEVAPNVRASNPHVLKACHNLEELNAHLSTGSVLLAEAARGEAIPLKSLTSIRIWLDDAKSLTAPDFGTATTSFVLPWSASFFAGVPVRYGT